MSNSYRPSFEFLEDRTMPTGVGPIQVQPHVDPPHEPEVVVGEEHEHSDDHHEDGGHGEENHGGDEAEHSAEHGHDAEHEKIHAVNELMDLVFEQRLSHQEQIAEALFHSLGHGHHGAHKHVPHAPHIPHEHPPHPYHEKHFHHVHLFEHEEEAIPEHTRAAMLTALAAALPQTPAEAAAKLAAEEATMKELAKQHQHHKKHEVHVHKPAHAAHIEQKPGGKEAAHHHANGIEHLPLENNKEATKPETPLEQKELTEQKDEPTTEQKGFLSAAGAAAAAVYGYMLRWRKKRSN